MSYAEAVKVIIAVKLCRPLLIYDLSNGVIPMTLSDLQRYSHVLHVFSNTAVQYLSTVAYAPSLCYIDEFCFCAPSIEWHFRSNIVCITSTYILWCHVTCRC